MPKPDFNEPLYRQLDWLRRQKDQSDPYAPSHYDLRGLESSGLITMKEFIDQKNSVKLALGLTALGGYELNRLQAIHDRREAESVSCGAILEVES